MASRLATLRAILVLPGNVLVVVPSLLAWLTGASLAGPGALRFWAALLALVAGISLMAGTIRRFATEGDGTLAPWDPTRHLVVTGVYRHVRNPMISGVVLNLVGLALLLGSRPIGLWAGLFALANALWIPLWEEPDLEERFGEPYRAYCRNVPRWIPRLTPWQPGPA